MNSNPFETLEQRLDTIDEKLSLILGRRDEKADAPTRYCTRQQAAERLHITLPTLHYYTMNGLIQGSRVGTRVLYTEEAINEAVKSIPVLRKKDR